MKPLEIGASFPNGRFGGLEPRYNFIVNPYPAFRLTRCPVCEGKTGQRKTPLLIHVDPKQLVALNYTCRFCPDCDLLIAHKFEIEKLMRNVFSQAEPSLIGNAYLVLGTLEKSAWRKGLGGGASPAETFPYVHDFKAHYAELRVTGGGWYPRDKAPPLLEPPDSKEWVKPSR